MGFFPEIRFTRELDKSILGYKWNQEHEGGNTITYGTCSLRDAHNTLRSDIVIQIVTWRPKLKQLKTLVHELSHWAVFRAGYVDGKGHNWINNHL